MIVTQAGDLVFLVSVNDRSTFLRKLETGKRIQSHQGELLHDDLIGKPYGSRVETHLGHAFFLLSPTPEEKVRLIRRQSQIIFPKDAGYIIMKLGIVPGARVLETGTGSGALSLAICLMVGDEGHLYSYDRRDDMQELAGRNLRRAGVDHRCSFINRDALEGFDESDIDAVFLDLPKPWDILDQAHATLRGGGVLGCIVPTLNQVTDLVGALERHSGYVFVEVEELLLRQYKTVPARIRPNDQMIGHTGFLIFARSVLT